MCSYLVVEVQASEGLGKTDQAFELADGDRIRALRHAAICRCRGVKVEHTRYYCRVRTRSAPADDEHMLCMLPVGVPLLFWRRFTKILGRSSSASLEICQKRTRQRMLIIWLSNAGNGFGCIYAYQWRQGPRIRNVHLHLLLGVRRLDLRLHRHGWDRMISIRPVGQWACVLGGLGFTSRSFFLKVSPQNKFWQRVAQKRGTRFGDSPL